MLISWQHTSDNGHFNIGMTLMTCPKEKMCCTFSGQQFNVTKRSHEEFKIQNTINLCQYNMS